MSAVWEPTIRNRPPLDSRTDTPRLSAASAGRLVRLPDGKARLIGTVPITIGREPSSDFPLEGEDVSRSHAYLLRTPQGFLLVDSSLHGTYVNGERVQAQRILADSDVLEIAGHSFRFDLHWPDLQPPGPIDAGGVLPATVEHPRTMPRGASSWPTWRSTCR